MAWRVAGGCRKRPPNDMARARKPARVNERNVKKLARKRNRELSASRPLARENKVAREREMKLSSYSAKARASLNKFSQIRR